MSSCLPSVFACYVAFNGKHLRALVIDIDEERADLAVFTSLPNIAGKKNFGTQFHQDVLYDSEDHRPGTWHWNHS